MIAWINFFVMLVSGLVCTWLYVKSVGPAALEKKIGKIAYKKCARYRMISSILMIPFLISWGVYYFYPLPLPIPRFFPWKWWISIIVGMCIAIPCLYILGRAVRDAGEETTRPKKEHKLYSGIYKKIRHPQLLGELPFAWVVAFLLNSPFLALLSFVCILPLFYIMAWAEEKDLVIRYGEEYLEYKKNTGCIIPKRSKSR